MNNQEEIEYFKTNFNIDLANKTEEETIAALEKIERDLNRQINKTKKENLELERKIIQLLSQEQTDN